MGGMCKKHFDRVQDAEGMLEMSLCMPVGLSPGLPPAGGGNGNRSLSPGNNEVSVSTCQSLGGLNKVGDGGSGGELSGDGGESVLSSPSSSAMYGIKPCPSWGSAAPSLTTVPSADATATPSASYSYSAGCPCENEGALIPSASAPDLAAIGRHYYRRSHGMKAQPSSSRTSKGHQRGLSIFEEMHTVNAIINSSSAEKSGEAQQPQKPQRQGVGEGRIPPPQPARPSLPPPRLRQPPLDYPPRYPQSQASSHDLSTIASHGSDDASISTKTPAPQVSFADCVKVPRTGAAGARAHNSQPCTGNASCTCDACRSPTLAIFEQMIVASQKLENGDLELQYAGLSPPKLGSSPRKLSSNVAAGAVAATLGTTTPSVHKQVSFLPDEPTSTGSVVRKVSSTNIVGESWESAAARTEEEGRHAMHQGSSLGNGDEAATQKRKENSRGSHHSPKAMPAMAIGVEGHRLPLQQEPAPHALAATITLGRTVSHDVDDGQQRYHRVHPSAVVQDRRSRTDHHHQGHSQHQRTVTRPCECLHPISSQQALQAPLLPKRPYHHGGGATVGTTPRDIHLPQTPTLYDNLCSSVEQHPISVVSTHSAANRTTTMGTDYCNHHYQHLLPKPRENRAFEHLFVPKEV